MLLSATVRALRRRTYLSVAQASNLPANTALVRGRSKKKLRLARTTLSVLFPAIQCGAEKNSDKGARLSASTISLQVHIRLPPQHARWSDVTKGSIMGREGRGTHSMGAHEAGKEQFSSYVAGAQHLCVHIVIRRRCREEKREAILQTPRFAGASLGAPVKNLTLMMGSVSASRRRASPISPYRLRQRLDQFPAAWGMHSSPVQPSSTSVLERQYAPL